MAWRVARSLETLRNQFNQMYPNRDRSSDGTIGDAAHKSRSSDHNAWIQDAGQGVVSALDITHDPKNGVNTHTIADHLRVKKDPRIKYVISNKRIFSSVTKPWTWRRYNGSNPHIHHMHVSVKSTKSHYDDTRAWDLPGGKPEPELDAEVGKDDPIERPILKRRSKGEYVKIVQRLLGIKADGEFGQGTHDAVKGFQRGAGLKPDGIVGPMTWEELDSLEQLPEAKWHEDIIATVFGGRGDPNQSAYENRMINDQEFGVALPHRFVGDRPQVVVANRLTGKQVTCEIVDVGPWNTDDPYWEKNKRPHAEGGTDRRGRKTNKAGIDLTPAAAREIGLSGLGKVHWAFAEEEEE